MYRHLDQIKVSQFYKYKTIITSPDKCAIFCDYKSIESHIMVDG